VWFRKALNQICQVCHSLLACPNFVLEQELAREVLARHRGSSGWSLTGFFFNRNNRKMRLYDLQKQWIKYPRD
jgi:hypothetical protein